MTGRASPKKDRPKVVLVMIVRDEAAIIRERLEAVVGRIDGWCIVDTGSVDGTGEIVENVMREHEKPGVLVPKTWAGFADARTFAVQRAAHWTLAQGGEWWALLLDADTIFHAMPNWRQALNPIAGGGPDLISCEVHHGSIRYVHPRLLKLGEHAWRWRGVLHEYLVVPAGARGIDCPMIHVEHGSGGARSKDPEKFWKDGALLAEARAEIAARWDHPDRDLVPRYAFYEAQSWRDAGRIHTAAEVYLERTTMGGFFQEVYLSWLNLGEIWLAGGQLAPAMEAWTRAWAVDPSRAEALVGLATICRSWEAWIPAYHYGSQARVVAASSGGMFHDTNVHWRANFEVSVAAFYVGKFGEGKAACERVLVDPLTPPEVVERTRANRELYVAAIATEAARR